MSEELALQEKKVEAAGLAIGAALSEVIKANEESATKAEAFAKSFIDFVEKNGMNDDTLAKGESLTKKLAATEKAMKERRTSYTQQLDVWKKRFTTPEATVKNIADQVSKKVADRKNEKLREAQEIAAKLELEKVKTGQRISVRTDFKNSIYNHINNWRVGQNNIIDKTYEQMTIANASAVEKALSTMHFNYTQEEHCKYVSNVRNTYIADELEGIKNEMLQATYIEYKPKVEKVLNEHLREVLSRIPSRIEELKVIEEKRKENAAEADRLERLAEAKRKEEKEKETLKLQQEAEEREKKQKADENAAMMQASFTAAVAAPKVELKGYEIEISNKAAWANIYQLWFTMEGENMDDDKFGKMTMSRMKAYCEKHAFKNKEFIEHAGITYKEIAK